MLSVSTGSIFLWGPRMLTGESVTPGTYVIECDVRSPRPRTDRR